MVQKGIIIHRLLSFIQNNRIYFLESGMAAKVPCKLLAKLNIPSGRA